MKYIVIVIIQQTAQNIVNCYYTTNCPVKIEMKSRMYNIIASVLGAKVVVGVLGFVSHIMFTVEQRKQLHGQSEYRNWQALCLSYVRRLVWIFFGPVFLQFVYDIYQST